LGVSRQGEFKNTIQIFLQKVHVENFSQNFDKHFQCQFFLDFFLFYRVFGCFSAMGVQKHYKKRFTKTIVSKSFYQKFDQKSKTDFFSILFLSRFWAFLDEGSSKTRQKKYQKNQSHPSPFSYSDPPTHHGGPRLFFLAGPLDLRSSLQLQGAS
jgi:hypothetical protein